MKKNCRRRYIWKKWNLVSNRKELKMVIGLNQLDHHSPICNDDLNNCDIVMKENDGIGL